jgi:succinate-semialdehyde dehydrogenase/glutarate-semialdehyde dehydrogenase
VTIQSIDPSNGTLIAQYRADDSTVVDAKLDKAITAYASWKDTPLTQRANSLRRVGKTLLRDLEKHAQLMTLEMGKPIREARAEITKCAWVLDYYADNAATFLRPRDVETDGSRSFVRFDPIGPILAIMPWNFPYWQVIRFAAPNLIAGNVGLLKHAPNVSGCALAIQDLFENAGLPEGVFQTLIVPVSTVKSIIDDERVSGVTLTGSEAAGRSVGGLAGHAIKPSVLELGGSDPFIVLSDGDPLEASKAALVSRMLNSGQSCIAAKRLIVEKTHYQSFVDYLTEGIRGLKLGDPKEEATDVGPLAKREFVETLHHQVVETLAEGGRCIMGGSLLPGQGSFYPPTLLVDVSEDMTCFREETFGPVATVLRAKDDKDAIRLANKTRFGLGASLWTTPERGVELATHIEAGHVAINGMVKSDPRLPFGGVKASGYGRELSEFGLLPFLNIKTVWVR